MLFLFLCHPFYALALFNAADGRRDQRMGPPGAQELCLCSWAAHNGAAVGRGSRLLLAVCCSPPCQGLQQEKEQMPERWRSVAPYPEKSIPKIPKLQSCMARMVQGVTLCCLLSAFSAYRTCWRGSSTSFCCTTASCDRASRCAELPLLRRHGSAALVLQPTAAGVHCILKGGRSR